jgi:hypothetical protein
VVRTILEVAVSTAKVIQRQLSDSTVRSYLVKIKFKKSSFERVSM